MSETAAESLGFRGFLYGSRVIYAREMGAYFDSAIASIYASVFLLLSCGLFMNGFFLAGVVDMSEYFDLLPLLLVLFIPGITMRSWAEERSSGTIEFIMTLPMRPAQLVLGKYFAALSFYLIVLAGSLPLVVMLMALGNPDLGQIFASYVGAALLGAFFLSYGVFLSALTTDQIVAFVLSVFVGAIFVLSGNDKVVEVLDGLAPQWQIGTWLYESVSVLPHFESFVRGVMKAGDLLYFALMSGFFLVMNELTIRRIRY